MDTKEMELSLDEITDLTTDVPFESNKSYTIQALDGTVMLTEQSIPPTTNVTASYRLQIGETWEVEQGTRNIYAWGNSRITVGEA